MHTSSWHHVYTRHHHDVIIVRVRKCCWRHFFVCLDDERTRSVASLEALPRLTAELPPIMPCCIMAAEAWRGSPTPPPMVAGMPRCNRIDMRRSCSARDTGRGDVAETRNKMLQKVQFWIINHKIMVSCDKFRIWHFEVHFHQAKATLLQIQYHCFVGQN